MTTLTTTFDEHGTLTINGETVTFSAGHIKAINARNKLGLTLERDLCNRKIFRSFPFDSVFSTGKIIAAANVPQFVENHEQTVQLHKKCRAFFDNVTDSGDIFSVWTEPLYADGYTRAFRKTFNTFKQALAHVEQVKSLLGDNHAETVNMPDTTYFKAMPRAQIQTRIDELDRVISDNNSAADNYDYFGDIYGALFDANKNLHATRDFYTFVLHEDDVSKTAVRMSDETISDEVVLTNENDSNDFAPDSGLNTWLFTDVDTDMPVENETDPRLIENETDPRLIENETDPISDSDLSDMERSDFIKDGYSAIASIIWRGGVFDLPRINFGAALARLQSNFARGYDDLWAIKGVDMVPLSDYNALGGDKDGNDFSKPPIRRAVQDDDA